MHGDRFSFTLYLPSLGGPGRMGGAERVATTLAAEIARRGIPTSIVVNSLRTQDSSEVPPGVEVVDLRAGGVLTSLCRLVAYRWRERPHYILSFMSIPNVVNVLSGLAGPPRSRRTLISERSSRTIALCPYFPDKSRWLQHFVCRIVYPFADGIIACSHGVASLVRLVHPQLSDRTVAIGNPVRLRNEDEVSKDVHPWLGDDSIPCLVSVGKLIPAKDHLTLLRAVAVLRESIDLRCLILGEGSQHELLVRESHQLGIYDHVQFLGHQDNPRDYVRRAAVYVHTSAWEGMPNAILEAIAEGTPVVATDCMTGPGELLDGCPSSRLVPVGDDNAVAKAVVQLLAEDIDRARIVAHALKFTPERIASRYVQAIDEFLD